MIGRMGNHGQGCPLEYSSVYYVGFFGTIGGNTTDCDTNTQFLVGIQKAGAIGVRSRRARSVYAIRRSKKDGFRDLQAFNIDLVAKQA